mmetsp:Transcript_27247/g.57863  ORF Transcript_27247/g.57863 Transcript_27247/m.57863 type:complete len:200 (-) Transcript_27247:263-862(-)
MVHVLPHRQPLVRPPCLPRGLRVGHPDLLIYRFLDAPLCARDTGDLLSRLDRSLRRGRTELRRGGLLFRGGQDGFISGKARRGSEGIAVAVGGRLRPHGDPTVVVFFFFRFFRRRHRRAIRVRASRSVSRRRCRRRVRAPGRRGQRRVGCHRHGRRNVIILIERVHHRHGRDRGNDVRLPRLRGRRRRRQPFELLSLGI